MEFYFSLERNKNLIRQAMCPLCLPTNNTMCKTKIIVLHSDVRAAIAAGSQGDSSEINIAVETDSQSENQTVATAENK